MSEIDRSREEGGFWEGVGGVKRKEKEKWGWKRGEGGRVTQTSPPSLWRVSVCVCARGRKRVRGSKGEIKHTCVTVAGANSPPPPAQPPPPSFIHCQVDSTASY